MKILFLACFLLFSVSAVAADFSYTCTVNDLASPGSQVKELTLNSKKGKMVDAVLLDSKKYKVQIELYFSRIQIHILSSQENSVISSSTAPEGTSPLSLALSNIAAVTCTRN